MEFKTPPEYIREQWFDVEGPPELMAALNEARTLKRAAQRQDEHRAEKMPTTLSPLNDAIVTAYHAPAMHTPSACFHWYEAPRPEPKPEVRIPVFDYQAQIERAKENALYESLKKAKFEEYARLEAREEWEASKQAAVDSLPIAEPAPAQPGTRKRWTPDFLAEVRAYRERHTEKETAAKFGVSGSYIRRKLAGGTGNAKPRVSLFPTTKHRIK